jgi:predicted 2-oxoglutarate/Fe(II)-dependent dioxygenase YbiX
MTNAQQYRPPFPPRRSEPCFCGSGRRFKHCCGSTDRARPAPHGIEIVEDFLSADECREWVEFAASRPSSRLRVIDWKADDPAEASKLDDRRVTERVDMGEDRDRQLRELMERIYVATIAPRLERKFAWFESPQILKYGSGGFYEAHADADTYDPDRGLWYHHLDRDISVLLYLNDEFEGGDLEFAYFDFHLRPKPGMLVWFPSDSRYFHRANPVASGMRYAVVSWAALSDTEKLYNGLPDRAVLLDPNFLPPSASPPGA